MQKLDDEIKNLQQYKLDKAEEDLTSQFDKFTSIAFNIALNPYFKPSFINLNAYNEFLMVKDFNKYIDQSQIASDILFVQKDSENIYNNNGKYYRWVYFEKVLGMDMWENFIKEIEDDKQPELRSITNSENKKIFLYTYPVSTINISMDRKDAFIIFVLRQDDLLNRINTVAGGLDGEISIYWENNLLLGSAQSINGGGNILYGASSSGSIKCTLRLFSVKYTEPVNNLRIIYGWVLSLISLLCVILCFLIAYSHYKPLQSLEKHINLQNRQLYYDALNLLVTGSKKPEIDYYKNLGINLEVPNYCVILLKFKYPVSAADRYQKIYLLTKKCIEEKNSAEFTGYLFEPDPKSNILTVVCGLGKDPREIRRRYTEYLANVFIQDKTEIIIAAGSIYNSSLKLGNSMAEALTAAQYQPQSDIIFFDELENIQPDSMDYTSADILLLIQSMKLGITESCAAALDNIMEKIRTAEITQMMKRCIIFDVINSVLKTAISLKMDVSHLFLSKVTTIENPDELKTNILPLLEQICCIVNEKINAKKSGRAGEIIEYINQNFKDHNFSLKALSEKFNLSINHISRMIKENSGQSFHEYFSGLRIEEAKKLLIEGRTNVKDICRSTGYTNVSNFIKVFKTYTGMTPEKFREIH
ncbi:MAG: AraC family transcriptional regulator [Treponema sp.]|nr:AraC family transcriptional regulator [Treponema sp.]